MPSPVTIKKLLAGNPDSSELKKLLEEQAQEIQQLSLSVEQLVQEKEKQEQVLTDTRFQLSMLLETSESVQYLVYKNRKEKNFFSHNWEKVLGFSPQQVANPMLEKSNSVIIGSLKEYEKKWEEFESVGRLLVKYQIHHPASDKIIWLEEEVYRKFDPNLNDELWAGTIKDISGIQFYKDYIEESELRFKRITDKLPIMIWASNEDDEITYYNDQARDFFGILTGEKRKMGDMDQWIHPDYVNKVLRDWDEKATKREAINTELLCKDSKGEYHFLALQATPRFLKNGQFIGYIGASYDLTNEYQLREEREKAFIALKESEEKYKSLFDNMELGILEVDNEERIVYTNEALGKIAGYSAKEMIGEKASNLFLAHTKDRKKMEAERKIREKGRESVYEINLKKKDGQLARVIISGAPLFDNQGNIRGSVGIHWDVTGIRAMEQKLIDQKIKKEKELIEARLQAEDQQRSVIGRDLHDGVGQMLAYIGMYVGMIKSKGTLEATEFNELEKALQNTLEQVRTLSRTLAPPALQDLGLRDSIRELIASYAILQQPKFHLKLYSQREDYNLSVEKKMVVYRILQELLNNTFKYAEANNVSINIYFRGKKLHMDYTDDGRGYNPETISKGVGLDSMRSRITYYKGSIELESSPGNGSKAFITLPIG